MGIYSKIVDLQKLGQAWERVKRNKPACGVDNVTYEIFEERKREELRQLNMELIEHRYESLPVKLSQIYKGEKVRTIALFTMRDKIVQQSLAYELGRIYEPLFSQTSYAYRPGQSALDALKRIEEKIRRHENLWVLKMDIADFFDNISHDFLVKTLRGKIMEEDVLELTERLMKAKALDGNTGQLMEKEKGLYQGSCCSPILSNIFLMDYDRDMEEKCSFYMRYADDILILEQEQEEVKRLLEYSRICLRRKGLELNEAKTQLHCVTKQNGFTYLGYQFTSEGKSIPTKAVTSLTSRLEDMWMTSGLKLNEKIKKGQEILGGWEQYYRDERKPGSIIEFVLLLSMVETKNPEIRNKIESQRGEFINCYQDITKYMADYWKEKERPQNAVKEYEQFFQVPGEENTLDACSEKVLEELLECYSILLIQPSEEKYLDLMQLYSDIGSYQKAAHFWEEGTNCKQKNSESLFLNTQEISHKPSESTDESDKVRLKIQEYFGLFVGREDTYVRESMAEGRKRTVEQVMEPLQENAIKQHLLGERILGTYIQRPNHTAKYLVFDVDI